MEAFPELKPDIHLALSLQGSLEFSALSLGRVHFTPPPGTQSYLDANSVVHWLWAQSERALRAF